jgi:predicted transposase YdaD
MDPPAARSTPSYDKIVKTLLGRTPLDIGEWLLGERPESAEELDTTHALSAARTSDKLLKLRFRSRPGVLLHLEVQLQGDAAMPRRMAEYFGFSLHALERAAREGFQPAAVVLYLYREHYRDDPGVFDLAGDLGFRFHARYRVLKLWELPPEPVLRMESPGLCPFVPLMAGRAEELVVRSVEKITTSPEGQVSFDVKRFLLRTLLTMAQRLIKDPSLLESLFSDPELMETDFFFLKGQKIGREEGRLEGRVEGRVEGREEGVREGQEQALRGAVTDFLAARFGPVPGDLETRLSTVRNRDDLKRLVTAAARAADLAAFRRELDALSTSGG